MTENDYIYDEERILRRRQRINEMKRKRERQLMMRRLAIPAALICVLCVVLIVFAVRALAGGAKKSTENKAEVSTAAGAGAAEEIDIVEEDTDVADNSIGIASSVSLASANITLPFVGMADEQALFISENVMLTLGGKSSGDVLYATADENTIGAVGDTVSGNVVFIDVDEGRIMAQKGAKERISPASMTKILTVLVAAEHITDENDTFEITIDITDYSYSNDCSSAGFEVGEVVTVKDLFYGTILPSGADAAVALAKYVAGSHEEFVELMNEKLEELGLSETSHFTNCVGLYDDDHYSTVYDIAVILKAAYDNEYCREVLSAHMYTTTPTEQHPDGISLSNLFLRRIEDSDTHGEVLCAKTGYVVQSKNCAASLSIGDDGKLYICVTAQSSSSWQCIRDHVAYYQYLIPSQ